MGGNRTLIDNSGVIAPPHNGSWNAWQDGIQHFIASGKDYSEPFRVTCPNVAGEDPYCADYDKLRGQGVSLKISNTTNPSEVLQLEYALVQNPLDKLDYHKLNYDVSLLDCADPLDHPELWGDDAKITDKDASAEDRKHKVELCPGYKDGLKVSFKADEGSNGNVCESIDCKENEECKVYYFDRTRTNEPSLSCAGEFKGNMVLDLCAGSPST
jgi:hypothetical protein